MRALFLIPPRAIYAEVGVWKGDFSERVLNFDGRGSFISLIRGCSSQSTCADGTEEMPPRIKMTWTVSSTPSAVGSLEILLS
jgi:hypothetical protein